MNANDDAADADAEDEEKELEEEEETVWRLLHCKRDENCVSQLMVCVPHNKTDNRIETHSRPAFGPDNEATG
jgi:hypothetical protein